MDPEDIDGNVISGLEDFDIAISNWKVHSSGVDRAFVLLV